jgi:peptidase E
MNVILTSDLPLTPNHLVFDRMRTTAARPRIAWIPPFTDSDRKRFAQAHACFAAYGFDRLDYCDIDTQFAPRLLARLADYDIVYFAGGDPLIFQRNLQRTGLAEQVCQYVEQGGLVVAASGGAMQLTQNLSLFRLRNATVDAVLTNYSDYPALGIVDYELLPHLNRYQPPFLERVRHYSERIAHDVIGLFDGAALLHTTQHQYHCSGQALRFRNGVASRLDT